jgi:hypothetical protein
MADRGAVVAPKSQAAPAPDAGRVLHRESARSGTNDGVEAADFPSLVFDALSTPGEPLDPKARHDMEHRFAGDFASVPVQSVPSGPELAIGRADDPVEAAAQATAARALCRRDVFPRDPAADLAAIRVHADARAAQAARAVDARAFTAGSHLFFDQGEYRPDTEAGRLLLAHELAHAAQAETHAPTRLRRAPKVPSKKKAGVSFWFSVQVREPLAADDLLVEFVRQYYRLATREGAEARREGLGWKWVGKPQIATAADVKKGYVLLHVRDDTMKPQDPKARAEREKNFKLLAPGQRTGINTEADRLFWEKTRYKVGGQLGNSPDDKKMAQHWLDIRDELLRERGEIDALPPRVRKFLFTEDAPRTVEPKDYATVLRIAQKLANLSDSELEDYKLKVNEETTEWGAFESSIDRYVAARAQREGELRDRETKKTRIYGLDQVYQLYKSWKAVRGVARMTPSVDEFGVRDPNANLMRDEAKRLEADLTASLERYGFKSIPDFEQAVHDYEDAFARETVAIAFDMLARYDHVLYEEEKKFRDPSAARALADRVGQTQARTHYLEAVRESQEAEYILPDPDLHGYLPGELEEKLEHRRKASEVRVAGEAEVKGATTDPLVSNNDFDREALARANPADVQALMLDYIAARRNDIRQTRANLQDDHELIYKLDDLLKASFESQQISPGTIYDLVIKDKIHDVHVGEAIIKIAVAVFAVAIGLLTFGTGTVAVLAAVATFGISSYQAYQAYREYEVASAAHGAKLLSDDPSFGWVIVAIVGAGIDLAAAAAALKAMKPAIEAFNASGDVAKLAKELEAIAEVNEAMRLNVLRAAEAETQYRTALKGLFEAGGRLNMVFGPQGLPELTKVVYYALKRGLLSFERFMLVLKQEKLLTETALEAEQLTKLKGLFEEAKVAAEDLATHGKTIGMTEQQTDAFVKMWSQSNTMTLDEVKAQMQVWAATKKSGLPFGFAKPEQFDLFSKTAVKGLRRAGYGDTEAILQGSATSGISFAEQVPRMSPKDFDVALAGRSLFEKARKAGMTVERNPMRIGPLNDGEIELLGLTKLRGEMETAAGAGRTVNFMLFGNSDAATRGIAGIPPESLILRAE